MRFTRHAGRNPGSATALAMAVSTLCLATVVTAAPAPTTAAPRAWATKLTNIAAAANGGRIVGVSSTLDKNDPKFAAANLIDGKVYNPQTQTGTLGWASDRYDPINMEYVIIGFRNNEQKTIGKLVLDPAAGVTPERWAKDVSVEVSTETAEGPYQPVAELTLANKAQKQEFTILPAAARFVRLQFRTNYGSDRAVALGEVEIYEAVNTIDPLGDVITRMEGAVHELRQYRQNLVDMGANAGPMAEAPAATHDAALTGPTAPLSPATLQLIDAQTGTATVQDAATSGAVAPRPATGVQPATNIAAAKNGGKIVDYSSTYMSTPDTPDAKYKPENLIDGQVYTVDKDGKGTGTFGWASEGFAPGQQYVTIGFRNDRTHVINKLTLNPASEQSPGRWARRVEVQVTTGDPKSKTGWRTVTTVTLQIQPVPQDFSFASVEAKYVRLVFMANGPDLKLSGNSTLNINPDMTSDRAVALGEVEIYEPIVPAAALDSLIGHFEQILIDLKRLADLKDKQPVALEATPALAGPQVANGDAAPATKDGDTPAL